MNKVFLSGRIAEKMDSRLEEGERPHLVLKLNVQHRTKAGELRKESYRVNAWNAVARWGAEHLQKGQVVGVQGYLTQREIRAGYVTAVSTEVAVDEFLPMQMAGKEEAPEEEQAAAERADAGREVVPLM